MHFNQVLGKVSQTLLEREDAKELLLVKKKLVARVLQDIGRRAARCRGRGGWQRAKTIDDDGGTLL